MAETEKPNSRPKCGWKVEEKHASGGTSTRPCGSEEGLYSVRGYGRFTGRTRETPVCERHILKAWESWRVEEARSCTPEK